LEQRFTFERRIHTVATKKWCYLTVHPKTKVKVDQKDFEMLNEYSWRVTKGTTGRPRVVTSFRTPKGVRTVTLGAFLMKPPTGKQVYPRRFNDGLDYRRENLIICTLAERQRLLPKKRINASSSYRGVSFSRSEGKWRAGIEVEGRSINLGSFEHETDAARAYNKAARKYFGSMAYQNNVDNPAERRRKRR
jgi:hypothetical protein